MKPPYAPRHKINTQHMGLWPFAVWLAAFALDAVLFCCDAPRFLSGILAALLALTAAAFGIVLAIELHQDRRLNEFYRNEK